MMTPSELAKAEAILAGKGWSTAKQYDDPKAMDLGELTLALGNPSARASAEKAMKRKGWDSHPYLTWLADCDTELRARVAKARKKATAKAKG